MLGLLNSYALEWTNHFFWSTKASANAIPLSRTRYFKPSQHECEISQRREASWQKINVINIHGSHLEAFRARSLQFHPLRFPALYIKSDMKRYAQHTKYSSMTFTKSKLDTLCNLSIPNKAYVYLLSSTWWQRVDAECLSTIGWTRDVFTEDAESNTVSANEWQGDRQ